MRVLLEKGEKTALIGKDIDLTYDALLNQVSLYSSVLGDAAHQRVAIFSDNSIGWIFALYAIIKNKGITVPVDALSTPHDVAWILKDCRPVSVFVARDKLAVLQEAIKESGHYPAVIIIEDIKPDTESLPAEEIVITDEESTAVILYTSGTTGKPKGVMLSYKNIFTNLDAVCQDVPIYTKEERVMVLLPVHHVFSLVGTLIAPLYVHSTLVINTSLAAEEMIGTLQKYKVSIMIGVPRLYQLLYKGLNEKIRQSIAAKLFLKISSLFNSLKLSRLLFGTVHKKFGGSLKYLVCGGAAIEPKITAFFLHLGFEILEGYGLTETAPMISFTRPGKVRPGLPGQPLKNVRVEIREGEVVVSGNNVMQGYYNKPADTESVLKDGWFYTGDLGFLDKKGYLHITGRKKDIIVLPNGKNINPAELEESISTGFDEVKECGVFMKDGALQAIILPDFKKLSEKSIKDYENHLKWN
ncbi:MAG: AMP-forming long-chain acyl-CoA synthetase, partial [Bacteroidetes bacterium]|nr:AMP-forming long-chain acyl-CoA synthetase [Bacteroidota bacterium]